MGRGRLIDIHQAANVLGVSYKTLYDWRKNRKPDRPKEYKIGRRLMYDRDELEEWIDNQKAQV